ncbi:MAG: hypothetical protein HOH04_15470 [Rhodospirillaceae bacterium]|mgnify:CR=1 FL=1|jgi:hypothetical protein|nr:hypothetical protein [Rhodospirillaceae bacterium]
MIRAALIVTALISVTAAPARAEDPAWFTALDADASGTISVAEMHQARFERFKRADTDRNGSLTRKEVGSNGNWVKWFGWYDTNTDDRISMAEYEAKGRERFLLMDTDRDGRVTLVEIHNLTKAHAQSSRTRPTG